MNREDLGRIGQERAKWLLRGPDFAAKEVFQVDWISREGDWYVLNEVKNQEAFLPPPFKGHGLPKWQIDARLAFQERMGLRCRLIVFDPQTPRVVLWQWLDVLETGTHYDTNGKSPRRIYAIENYYTVPV